MNVIAHDLAAEPDADIERELLTLNANLNAATYRFLVLIREFERRNAWGDWGMRSMAHWLGWPPVSGRGRYWFGGGS